MMKKSMKRLYMTGGLLPLAVLALGGLLSSCSGEISGTLTAAGSGDFTVKAALQPRMENLIGRLSAALGEGQARANILDGAAIGASMSKAPGVNSAFFKNSAPAAIEGPVQISNIAEFLAPGGGKGFISLAPDGDAIRLGIRLSRETGPGILSLVSPEITDYLSVLMAPIATGETVSRSEYLFLVASVYGKDIADEISEGRIKASIEFPGPLRSVKGGSFSKNLASFDIPLLDLLVLESPLEYEAVW
ncbi:MAG: hypothetical protein LBR96_00145 [Treponema sp.]|jgi:hypothetical protein|nr:hypothetical protein [Treponema sp.]